MKKIAMYRFITKRLKAAGSEGRIKHGAFWYTAKLHMINRLTQ